MKNTTYNQAWVIWLFLFSLMASMCNVGNVWAGTNTQQLDETQPVTILLGQTPELTGPFHNGQGMLIARVTAVGSAGTGLHRVKIVAIYRLWKRNSLPKFARRDWPQIKAVPFEDENGVMWNLEDGKEWRKEYRLICRYNQQSMASLKRGHEYILLTVWNYILVQSVSDLIPVKLSN
ncbi:hypothetical protein TI04_11795 [Achromatium sp. WMS2]|nr:hypothetical protein TI04_11795 [Achromatium sp. WMS2]